MEDILHTLDEGVLQITLNRPALRNAITPPMYLELARLLTHASDDAEIRVVVLQGAGGYFSGGNDLGAFLNPDLETEGAPLVFLKAISQCSKPIVAAVEGGAIGIGTTLLLHCDVAYAGNSTRLQMPFINFALCPEGASSLLLPRLAGYKRAAAWLLLGEAFTAADAVDAGILTQVVADGSASTHALAAARRLATFSASAVQHSKALLRRADREEVNDTLVVEGECFMSLLKRPEAQAAISGFLRSLKKSA